MTAREAPAARPRGPWGSLPLNELVVLVALVLAAFGIVWWGSERGLLFVGTAAALGSLAGLELALREHFAGYRAHPGLIAGAIAMLVSVPCGVLLGVAPMVTGGICATVFAFGYAALRRGYRRRAGVL